MRRICSKSGVPKPVTYEWNPKSIDVGTKRKRTNRIPPGNGSESIGVAARVVARRDIVEAREPEAAVVQPEIEEAERRAAG